MITPHKESPGQQHECQGKYRRAVLMSVHVSCVCEYEQLYMCSCVFANMCLRVYVAVCAKSVDLCTCTFAHGQASGFESLRAQTQRLQRACAEIGLPQKNGPTWAHVVFYVVPTCSWLCFPMGMECGDVGVQVVLEDGQWHRAGGWVCCSSAGAWPTAAHVLAGGPWGTMRALCMDGGVRFWSLMPPAETTSKTHLEPDRTAAPGRLGEGAFHEAVCLFRCGFSPHDLLMSGRRVQSQASMAPEMCTNPWSSDGSST